MKRSLRDDLARVRGYAFRRAQACSDLLRQFHALRKKIKRRREAGLLWNLYDWLTMPLSLWPVDFVGLGRHVLSIVAADHPCDAQLLFLLETVGPPPNEKARRILGDYEHDVSKGRYEKLVRQPAKYEELERQLAANAQLRSAWAQVKQHFPVARYRNEGGVVRRRMSQERNFREGWEVNWRSPANRFLTIFDALCYRWDLYGFEKDKPLPLKLTVNPLPHGTMIVIPRHWSFDNRRDLNWREIGKLHSAHGATRQGPKMSMARLERRDEAQIARKHWEDATRKGLKGDKRDDFVLGQMRLDPRTDQSHIKRLLRLARG